MDYPDLSIDQIRTSKLEYKRRPVSQLRSYIITTTTFWIIFKDKTIFQPVWFVSNDQMHAASDECDQKKSPNVYETCPKLILLEKW